MTLIWMRRCWHGEASVVRQDNGSYVVRTRQRGATPIEYELVERVDAMARARAWAEAKLPVDAEEWAEL